MKGRVLALANSPTATTWLAQAVVPLRYLLLTPLILSRFSKIELDVFYLIASTNLVSTIAQQRLADVFLKMLSAAHAGASELGEWRPTREVASGKSNWPLFFRCYACFGLLLLAAAVPAFLFGAISGWYAVGRLTDFSYEQRGLWAALLLGTLSIPVSLYFIRPGVALSAVGNIARCNRMTVCGELVGLVLATIGVLIGGRLLTVMSIQLLSSWVIRSLLVSQLPTELRAYGQKIKWDKQIFDWAKRPLWRGSLGMLATIGTQRSAGIFLAATGVPGFAATFLLAQNLLNSAYQVSVAPFTSQMPRYARLISRGEGKAIVNESFSRILLTTAMLTFMVVLAGLCVPLLLRLVGSNIAFIDSRTWFLLGGLKILHQFVTSAGAIHNLTNQMIFYRRNVFAAALSLPIFYVAFLLKSYTCVVLGLLLPSLVLLNIYPVRVYLELGGYKIRDMADMTTHSIHNLASKARLIRFKKA